MTLISRRLTVSELSQQILEMARTGVYRESIFEALSPLATKKQIREAIAHAKRFGLHSVASLRDEQLGTYYQLDGVKYQQSHHLLHSPAHLGTDADLMQRVTVSLQTMDRMLAIAKTLSILLALIGLSTLTIGQANLSLGFFSAAASAFIIWTLQRVQTPSRD